MSALASQIINPARCIATPTKICACRSLHVQTVVQLTCGWRPGYVRSLQAIGETVTDVPTSTSTEGSESQRPEALPPYPLEATQAMVEVAMLAAVSGLAFLLASLLKMENLLSYILPLPVVLAALRNGPWHGWRAAGATMCLLTVLLGPMRGVSYIVLHGGTAAMFGLCLAQRMRWLISVPLVAATRMLGQIIYLQLTSLVLNENLWATIVSNVHALLDQMGQFVGASGSPSRLTVQCMIGSLLLVNALSYSAMLHVVYRLLLGFMNYDLGPMPGFLRRLLYGSDADPTATAAANTGNGQAQPPQKG